MKKINLFLLGFCLFLQIFAESVTTEAKSVIFQAKVDQTNIDYSNKSAVLHGNIITAPEIACKSGHRLDSRKKCRKVFDF